MPAAYAGPAPSLSHSAKGERTKIRPSLALRVRVRWGALDLDAALADGADPDSSKVLALRAQQLADPKRRAKLARSIHHVLDVADRATAGRPYLSQAPFWTESVEDNRAQLLEVSDRLEAEASPAIKGVAMANLLVEDAASPLFAHRSAGRARAAVEAVVAALGR
jgi:hypothetical protein